MKKIIYKKCDGYEEIYNTPYDEGSLENNTSVIIEDDPFLDEEQEDDESDDFVPEIIFPSSDDIAEA